jgi:hypothetical protein
MGMAKMIWRPLQRPAFGMLDSISERIRTEEWRNPDLLTAVNRGHTLLVVSDYGGEHEGSRFQSISFLLADLIYLWHWDDERTHLRRHVLRDGRRLSYHRLESDQQRANALVPFLRASNSIPGLLITFLIDKRIRSLFERDEASDTLPVIDKAHWTRRSFERLLRIAHFSALVISGLVGSGQNVLWVSDRDEIVPNDDRHIEACRLFGHVLSHYNTGLMGRLQFATTRSDDGTRRIEDIAALPDFAAGALADVVTSMASTGPLGSQGVLSPMSGTLSRRAMTKSCG